MPSPYVQAYGIVSLTASTATITPDGYLGMPLVLNRAAGVTVTLPAASGSGNRYEFMVGTTVTSNGYIIKVANSFDTMVGNALVAQDGGDTAVMFEAGATADTITLNGTTTGGLAGAKVTVTDIAANKWFAEVVTAATGTEATVFSATV